MRRPCVAAALAVAFAAPVGAAAQWATGPVSGAMGGAGMVWATGVDAVELNPANLGFGRGWSLSLLDVGAAGLVTGTTLEDLWEIATAAGKGDRAVVDRLPLDGFRVAAVTEGYALSLGAEVADVPSPQALLPGFGLSWGPIGLRVRSRVLADAAMSREVADLTVSGFNPERIREYAVRETGFRVASFTEMTLAYGFAVAGRLGVGAGVRYVQGHRLAQGRFFEPEIDLDDETLRLNGVAVEAPGGTGWGVDLGLAVELGGGVRMSLAAQNVAQRMSWDEQLRTHEAVFTDDDFDSAELADLLDRFAETPLDPSAVDLPVYEAARGLFTQAYFPTVYRAGLGWAGGSGTRLEVNASAVSPRGRQSAPWEQRLSAGVEQRLKFLVLRAGYARAEDGIAALTGGLGLRVGPIRLDVAAGKLSGELNGIGYDGLQGSLGLSLAGGGR
ncbi:MAG: hypothetical protein Q8N53_22095 [Longimicrobiales bacterium]|nr:hypothetical protein [Longimicrobiales bacterium]